MHRALQATLPHFMIKTKPENIFTRNRTNKQWRQLKGGNILLRTSLKTPWSSNTKTAIHDRWPKMWTTAN